VFVPGSIRVFCNCHCVQSSPGALAYSYPKAAVGMGHLFPVGLMEMPCDANHVTQLSAED
jgi:hypothetical protein